MICFLPTSLISPFPPLAFLLFLEQTHPFSTSCSLHLLFPLSRTLFLYSMSGNLFLTLQDSVHISPSQGDLTGLFCIKEASTLITLSNLSFVVVFYLFLSEHFTEYEFMLIYLFLYFFFFLTPTHSLLPPHKSEDFQQCLYNMVL